MHPVITIFCPFTRRWAIDGWLSTLEGVLHDPALTNLCFIVDADEQYIVNTARRYAEKRNYRSFHVKINTNHRPNEVRLAVRRARVAEIHNQSKDLIAKTDGNIVIGLEDDTVFDRLESFDCLTQPLGENWRGLKVGFVEGVQMGRHGANILGAWVADDIHNPTKIETLLPPASNGVDSIAYQEITGGGWYGYATLRSLYMNHDYYTSTAQPWGPDVNYGFYVRQQGYCCLVDWSTIYGHDDHGPTVYPDNKDVRLAKIVYNKNLTTGKWERTDHEPTRY